MERKDIIKKIAQVKEEIKSNLVTKEGYQLPFDMERLFSDFQDLQTKLKELNRKIDKTNAEFLGDHLNELRIIDAIIVFYKECRKQLLADSPGSFYRDTDSKYTRNYDINKINEMIELFQAKRRKLDREIQKVNWTTELKD